MGLSDRRTKPTWSQLNLSNHTQLISHRKRNNDSVTERLFLHALCQQCTPESNCCMSKGTDVTSNLTVSLWRRSLLLWCALSDVTAYWHTGRTCVCMCLVFSYHSIIPSILLEITGGADILSLSKSANRDPNPDVRLKGQDSVVHGFKYLGIITDWHSKHKFSRKKIPVGKFQTRQE